MKRELYPEPRPWRYKAHVADGNPPHVAAYRGRVIGPGRQKGSVLAEIGEVGKGKVKTQWLGIHWIENSHPSLLAALSEVRVSVLGAIEETRAELAEYEAQLAALDAYRVPEDEP